MNIVVRPKNADLFSYKVAWTSFLWPCNVDAVECITVKLCYIFMLCLNRKCTQNFDVSIKYFSTKWLLYDLQRKIKFGKLDLLNKNSRKVLNWCNHLQGFQKCNPCKWQGFTVEHTTLNVYLQKQTDICSTIQFLTEKIFLLSACMKHCPTAVMAVILKCPM
jgi:hypothetical protein